MKKINKEENIKIFNTDRICPLTCMLCLALPRCRLNPASWSTLLNARSSLHAWDFPSSPAVKTFPSNAGGEGSIPDWEAKIPYVSRPENRNVKQKQYCNKFDKYFHILKLPLKKKSVFVIF